MNPANTPCTSSCKRAKARRKKIPLAGNSAYYSNAKWSPDSKHIAFNDNQLNLWDVEIASAASSPRSIGSDVTRSAATSPGRAIPNGSLTPSSSQIASTPFDLYSLDTGKTRRSPTA